MGGKNSKRPIIIPDPEYPVDNVLPQRGGFSQPLLSQYPPPEHHYAPNPKPYGRIADSFETLEEVTSALQHAGLESSNLIVGIDFTKSNEWTGTRSFNRRSLHHLGSEQNPYEQAISIIGKTLSGFDDDNLIPCYGFGDASTHDQEVFSFYPDDRFCNGFEDVLTRYREIVPSLRLAGPTSYAPIIEMAISIVEKSGGQYHVLLIIADGQVTKSVDTRNVQLSPQEQNTVDSMVKASDYPLSIILVGVGDGPWEMMHEFDDNIPARVFDNFQFVNFTDIMSRNMSISRKQTEFALAALMEIPSQYKATIELNKLGRTTGKAPERIPLPPPQHYMASTSQNSRRYSNDDSQPAPPPRSKQLRSPDQTINRSPPPRSEFDNKACVECLSNPKEMAFGCGHQTCINCGEKLNECPICRIAIQTRIKLI